VRDRQSTSYDVFLKRGGLSLPLTWRFVGVEALGIDRDDDQDVLGVSLGRSVVSTVACPVAAGEPSDGAFNAGADAVVAQPVRAGPLPAVASLKFMQVAGRKVDVRPSPGRVHEVRLGQGSHRRLPNFTRRPAPALPTRYLARCSWFCRPGKSPGVSRSRWQSRLRRSRCSCALARSCCARAARPW
jgi:hypothetical protein